MDRHVGEDIRSLRRSRGMTLADLAGAIGRSIGWLSQVERGRTTPSVRDLGAIAARLGVNISVFFRSFSRAPEERGLILGYGATIDHAAAGKPLTAFVSITPIDVSRPDDYPEKLRGVEEIESCWSVAGEESYILKVRVATPADLEALLARVRAAAHVSTRTTIVLSTPYENRSTH